MKLIDETEKLKLEFEQELAILTEKSTGEILLSEEFYGNPNCGVIDSKNKWVIIAGYHLIFWKKNKSRTYQNESFKWIHSIRIKNENIVKILIDPWSEKSSIWELNTENFELNKIKDFRDYRNKEFTDFVKW